MLWQFGNIGQAGVNRSSRRRGLAFIPCGITLMFEHLNTTYFNYRGDFLKQNKDTAMGSPILPVVVSLLFMEHFQKVAFSSEHNPPEMHAANIDSFTRHINSSHQVYQ